jgi:hypothetical protein
MLRREGRVLLVRADAIRGSAATRRAQPRRPPMADRGDRPMSTTIRVSMCAGMIMVCSFAASGEGRPAGGGMHLGSALSLIFM